MTLIMVGECNGCNLRKGKADWWTAGMKLWNVRWCIRMNGRRLGTVTQSQARQKMGLQRREDYRGREVSQETGRGLFRH